MMMSLSIDCDTDLTYLLKSTDSIEIFYWICKFKYKYDNAKIFLNIKILDQHYDNVLGCGKLVAYLH